MAIVFVGGMPAYRLNSYIESSLARVLSVNLDY